MATEVNTQIRQSSAGSSEVIRTQSADKQANAMPLQKRQELQGVEKLATSTDVKESAEQKEENLEQTVQELSSIVQSLNRELNFSVDADSGRSVIKVIDSATDEVIRQIPSEEVIELAQMIDQHAGLLMDAKV